MKIAIERGILIGLFGSLMGAAGELAAADMAAVGWWDRPTLTGDWFGQRAALQDRGVSLRGSLTHFLQGLAAGDGRREWELGGKLDGFVDLDMTKLGTGCGLMTTLFNPHMRGITELQT